MLNDQGYRMISLGKHPDRWELVSPEGKRYIVTAQDSGNVRCTCPGFKYRQECKHTNMIPKPEIKRYPLQTIVHMYKSFRQAVAWPKARIELVGSARRLNKDCKDMDILLGCLANDFVHFGERLASGVHELIVTKRGMELISGTYYGIPFDITRVADAAEWPFYLLYRTGSKDHNVVMRSRAKTLGLKLNEHGLWDGHVNILPDPGTEEAVYKALGMAYVPPNRR